MYMEPGNWLRDNWWAWADVMGELFALSFLLPIHTGPQWPHARTTGPHKLRLTWRTASLLADDERVRTPYAEGFVPA